MQQIIYRNSVAIQTVSPTPRRSNLTQWISRKWDLVGVLALMASSTTYGLFALSHLA